MLIFLIGLLIMLLPMTIATGGLLLQKKKNTPAIEAANKPEPDWLDENWDDPKYVAMIHRTRELEQDNFGYVVSVCLCTFHDNLAKETARQEAEKAEREEWWDVDIDKVNAATRAAKLETEYVFYNSKDVPGYKESQQLQMERWRDHLGREHIRAASIPTAQYVQPAKKDFMGYPVRDKYVPDTYSERMRLKEELFALQGQLEKLSAGFTINDGTGYSMSTNEYRAYKVMSDRIKQIKDKLPAYTSYDDGRYIEQRYRRGGEVEEYVMQDAYGKVIKRWKSGRY